MITIALFSAHHDVHVGYADLDVDVLPRYVQPNERHVYEYLPARHKGCPVYREITIVAVYGQRTEK
jgi:hypothetical protein